MRHNFHVRRLNLHDMAEVKDCERALAGKPGLDAEVLAYPATVILVAEDGKDKIYLPVQTCFFMETLGYQDANDTALALAMKQFTSILVWEMGEKGTGEMYFLGNNEKTNAFALNNGFEEVPYKVFRLKRQRPQSLAISEGSHNEGNHKD